MTVLAFDVETTGLPKNWSAPYDEWPRMVSFGYWLQDFDTLKYTKGEVIVKPEGFVIPEESTKIHKIEHQVALIKGIPVDEALNQIEKLFKKADRIIIHNASFDLGIITGEQMRDLRDKNKYAIFNEKVFCTKREGVNVCKLKKSRGGYKWPSMPELCRHCGIVNENEHNALSDAEALMKCYYVLTQQGVWK